MKFVEFQIYVQMEGEWSEEVTTPGHLDPECVESLYQDKDDAWVIAMKSGDSFKVSDDLPYILRAINV